MNKIKQLREEKAMTQYQLGKCLNVQNTTISMYEREERQLDTPTINKLRRFGTRSSQTRTLCGSRPITPCRRETGRSSIPSWPTILRKCGP